MKRLFIKLSAMCVLMALSAMAVILFLPLPEHAYDMAIIDKNQLLANTESPKIVLAGGSNLAFGIDSEAIRKASGVPVINMGVHAGFGLGRILDDIAPFLRSGDVLLIIPEYSHFTNSWNGSGVAYELIFDARRPRLLASLHYGPPKDFRGYLVSKLQTITARNIPPNPMAYLRHGFNEYGDYVRHLDAENCFFASGETKGPVSAFYVNRFFRLVDSFAKKGITVVLSYPSYEEQSWRSSAAVIEELDAIFREKENLRVISRPESYRFPKDMHYDTIYHLNAEGRRLRTALLIDDLEASGLIAPR